MLLVHDHGGPVHTVHREGVLRIAVTDSIAFAGPDLAGNLVVTGSHGGSSAGEYARCGRFAAIACSDAGIGKDAAGVAGLAMLVGVVGVAVSHDSARIGDGTDVWENGVVSYVNASATAEGVLVGEPVRDAFVRLAARWESREC